ncbi:hypothetical protein [Ruegeria sp. EL01]|uniref:hypothetical protein n=1 Tax=Ruegeria sp. EL01 TaxID=2107578 RepID=UPI000EA82354|nr:hypothetical protein [Ruegeria sp. EL01]
MGKSIKPDAIVWVHPFGAEVPIFDDIDRMDRFYRKRWGIKTDWDRATFGTAGRCYDKNGVARYALFIPSTANLGLIVHECSHIVDFVMHECGVPISLKNTEVRAYMLATLFCDVCHVLNRGDDE